MPNARQASFDCVTKDRPEKYHVWGTPQGHLQGQTRDNKKTRLFTLKRKTYTFLHNDCRIYVVLFEGIRFVLSYSTQRWNATCRWNGRGHGGYE